MSEIRTETVPLVDGSALRLTVAEPIGSVRGGIVVLHEARGMTDAVRNMVRGLAAEGWLTVAPHLYHRDDADEIGEDDGDRIRAQVGRIEGGQVMADTDTAFGWLAEHEVTADRMGVLGFDTGATVALLVATERTMGAAVSVADEDSVSAVRDRLPSTADAMAGLTCPWLGLYGRAHGLPAQRAPLRRRPGSRRRCLAAHAELVRRPPAVTQEGEPGTRRPGPPDSGWVKDHGVPPVRLTVLGGREAPGRLRLVWSMAPHC
jgi:carboxymethylenebutenolidase